MYALMGVVLIPFFLIAKMYAPSGAGIGMGYVILVPIVYGLIGFVFTAIACVIYNIVAGWTGGVEVEIAETSGGGGATI